MLRLRLRNYNTQCQGGALVQTPAVLAQTVVVQGPTVVVRGQEVVVLGQTVVVHGQIAEGQEPIVVVLAAEVEVHAKELVDHEERP